MKQYINHEHCPCGKMHGKANIDILIGKGVLRDIPSVLADMGVKTPFVLTDDNTYEAAGKAVCTLLAENGIAYACHIFSDKHLEPDEKAVGAAFMHFDTKSECIIGIGSGVINDIGKILSVMTGKKYIIVATAPSMDGYASASSSMTRDGLKISLPTRTADCIIGDTDILKKAPLHMLKSGIGDMLAKYISIGEWRIAHIVTGEYYCEQIADLVRTALQKCVENAEGLLRRDEKAVETVFEGLIKSGIAMAYAGVSRPASGVEHYFSHVWDMRAVAFGMPMELHGIQCGIGTLYAAKVYDVLKTATPDKEKAKAFIKSFDFAAYAQTLRTYIGEGAEPMIAAEAKDKKYDIALHEKRLAHICERWADIQKVMHEEIPSAKEIEGILDILEAPKASSTFGLDEKDLPLTFAATKDIRDKYVASRLCFDLGLIEEIFL